MEKLTLIIYSLIILVLSILMCLLVFGWIDLSTINSITRDLIAGDTSSRVILVISIIFILLSIKCLFFRSKSKKQPSEVKGILLENESGKLMISKETIENLVDSVAKGFESTQDVATHVELDRENNVSVYANLIVSSDVVIKDLSADLQNKIKEKVKKATDLEVKEVNITIKKVAEKVEENNA